MKRCFKCQIEKPLSEFYSHPRMKDGHLNKCKECARSDVKENYSSRRAEKHEYERQRNRGHDRRRYKAEAQQRHRVRNPKKYKATMAVGNALRDGRLVRGPCEVEGCTLKAEAHHDDYSKPLEVRWLCRMHHRAVHGQKADPF